MSSAGAHGLQWLSDFELEASGFSDRIQRGVWDPKKKHGEARPSNLEIFMAIKTNLDSSNATKIMVLTCFNMF